MSDTVLRLTSRLRSRWHVTPMWPNVLSSMTLPLRSILTRLGKCWKMGMKSSGLTWVEPVRDRERRLRHRSCSRLMAWWMVPGWISR